MINKLIRYRIFSVLMLLGVMLNLRAQVELNMQNGRFRICDGYILDSDAGKTKGYYEHNENYTLTLSMPGASKITLDFQQFCTEIDNDVLSIYDGKDTNSTLIGRYSGTKSLGKIQSSDSFITLHFVSDKSVSCTGWKAKITNSIIPPKAVKFSISKGISCNDTLLRLSLDYMINCDSINTQNTFINSLKIKSIKPVNCTNGLSKEYNLFTNGIFSQNGTYKLEHSHGYRDFCDSIYYLTSSISFTVVNCPLDVVLNVQNDTLCLGECIDAKTIVSGGNASNYKYTWNVAGLSGSTTKWCPKQSSWLKVTVTDGNAIPGADSIWIEVLQPPKAPADTQLCYYSNEFDFSGYPSGGRWYGKGITNTNKGTFNPKRAYGNSTAWYQIGSCADTMNISVVIPWNLENVFCPNTKPTAVYWYGPTGGTWSGYNITQDGVFNPDSIGTFTVNYEWKGCTSTKQIRVEPISVKKIDTTCESTLRDTLDFSPKGLIIRYFSGLINAYWGWYNPSVMGGPGNYDVIFQGRGTCRDTQRVTVLPCFAGLDDTVCPNTNSFQLTGFRKTNDAYWSGRGITNSQTGTYDPSWTLGQNAIDTVWLISSKCRDYKLIHIIGTEILSDSLNICPDVTAFPLSKIKTNISNGIWTGSGITKDTLCPSCLIPNSSYQLRYEQNGCYDELSLVILPEAFVPADTIVCKNLSSVVIPKKENGWFIGNHIDSNGNFNIQKAILDSVLIQFVNSKGCSGNFKIHVNSPADIDLDSVNKIACLVNAPFRPKVKPSNGKLLYRNMYMDSLNTMNMGSGNHVISYLIDDGICLSKDSWNIKILDTLNSSITASIDSVCKGDLITLRATGIGGTGNYTYQWSHGQFGDKAILNVYKTDTLFVTISDQCSEPNTASFPIVVHPEMWFTCITSDSVCYGQEGFIDLSLRNGDKATILWSYPPRIYKDTYFFPGGNSFKAFVTENRTGCFKDTVIILPSFKAVEASFSLSPPINGSCYTPLDEFLSVYGSVSDGMIGSYYLNGIKIEDLVPYTRVELNANKIKSNNELELAVANAAGCKDTQKVIWCYSDTIISFIPNSFTPNGDGLNDLLEWRLYGATEIEAVILNRWGQEVFKTNELLSYWDGNFDGKPCPEGVYVAYITYKNKNSFRKGISKSVMLLRTD